VLARGSTSTSSKHLPDAGAMGDEAERAPDDAPGDAPDPAAPARLTAAEALLAQAMGGPVRPGAARRSKPEPAYLTVARVLRAHGTHGEVACEVVTEFPQRFRRTKRVFLTPPPRPGAAPVDEHVDPAGLRAYAVEQARLTPRKGHAEVILRLAGIADRDEAAKLRGALVQVPESEAWKLPRGRFYWHQILGLRVVTTEGEELGSVAEILETGANDVYVVKSDGRERLIPAVKEIVKEIAPQRGEMIVELIPGL
jgi:16S rRNA processing protein RimM